MSILEHLDASLRPKPQVRVTCFPLTTFAPQDGQLGTLDMMSKRPMTGWLGLPEDPDGVLPTIKKFVQEKKGSWDKVIVLGIGGSALGIKAIDHAFPSRGQILTVVDNLDARTINDERSTMNPSRTLLLIISKSGTTLETTTLFEMFKEKYDPDSYRKHCIILTDPNEGPLRELATHDKLASFDIPPDVGGRYSVLSAVGLLPAALLGWNVDQLLQGAQAMKKRCLEKTSENPALQLALASFHHIREGRNINTMMMYSDALHGLGLWYQQLLAESIGKTKEVGITPLILRGASDQHSVLQLLQNGPDDKVNMFLRVEKENKDLKIPGSRHSVHELLNLECQATEQSLRESGRPTILIDVPRINEYHLGELFMLFQMQVAILGELFEVNAYDQPGVEKSKRILKTLL